MKRSGNNKNGTAGKQQLTGRRSFLKVASSATAGFFIAPGILTASGKRSSPGMQTRYPDPSIVIMDKRFENYILWNAAVERLWTGARWAEGPVWFGDGRYLLFSDIPNNRILRYDEESNNVTVYRYPSNNSNGNTRDHQGRLVTCEHDTQRITRTEYDGSITVLMNRYNGKRLNAPNDVVVHSNGTIWFTDPGYGILSDYEGHLDDFELPANVYCLDPSTGEASVVTGDFARPNGLCFSPDEKLLYIIDSGQPAGKPQPIRVYDVIDGRDLANGRIFCTTGEKASDGIRCDTDGNLWASASGLGEGEDGVHIYAPDGDMIGKIRLPEGCANLCFGGAKRNRLFMTASQSLYAVYLNARGALKP
jgi:gluconolactonase